MSGRYQEGYVAGHKKGMEDGAEMSYDDDTRRIIRLHDRIKELEAEIVRLTAEVRELTKGPEWEQVYQETITELRADNERLRAFAESVRNWKRLPLWELTDTDHERAVAFRRQLEIHAEAAHKTLEGK